MKIASGHILLVLIVEECLTQKILKMEMQETDFAQIVLRITKVNKTNHQYSVVGFLCKKVVMKCLEYLKIRKAI